MSATTTASADFSLRVSTSPFQAQGEISPGKNTLLHRTTAGFTPPRLGHKSFAASCPLALLGSAFYPVLVHRLAVYDPHFLPTVSHPSAVVLHFVRCGQLTGGLTPPGVRPCRAHKTIFAVQRNTALHGKPVVNQRNIAASVRARLLNRARKTRRDFNPVQRLRRHSAFKVLAGWRTLVASGGLSRLKIQPA